MSEAEPKQKHKKPIPQQVEKLFWTTHHCSFIIILRFAFSQKKKKTQQRMGELMS